MPEAAQGDGKRGEIETLLRRGTTAARLGDRDEARTAFREATQMAPTSVQAWLGLSGVVGTLTEKRQCFQRVLELDPGNEEAREGLEAVERRLSGRDVEPVSFAPAATPAQPAAAAEVEYCYRHPDRETGLHCMQCERPICGQCAHLTPVGQLCPECRRERRSPNYKVNPVDVAKAFAAGLIAGAIGSVLASYIGFFFMIFLGPVMGEGVMRAIEAVSNKRGQPMQIAAALAVLTGAGIVVLLRPVNAISLLIFLFLAISTVVARLR